MLHRLRRSNLALCHEHEKQPLRIVGDAAIAGPHVGNGRLIPVLILDTTARPDLVEFIRVHQYVPSGDVTIRWGRLDEHESKVALALSFIRPLELVAIIEFEIVRHGILVEQILSSRALYIQAGKEGDRIKHNVDAPKVIVEVPDTGFRAVWDKLYLGHVVGHMRACGLGRQQAKRAATQMIEEIRRLSQFRMASS